MTGNSTVIYSDSRILFGILSGSHGHIFSKNTVLLMTQPVSKAHLPTDLKTSFH
jgi:hypothetical protein